MEQDELLRHAARCFDKHGIRYFVTGAVAAIARDIAGILKISADAIDFAYIDTWARKLGLEEMWAAVSKRAGAL
jgi:hypothetical protein